MNATDCWTRESLKAYLSGWSDPELSSVIEAHLAQCATCEQTVVALEADPDTLIDGVRRAKLDSDLEPLSPNESPSDNSIMDSALSHVRHMIEGSLAADEQPPAPFPMGHFGAYDLLRPLASGGMGTVYLAKHRQLGKQVAVKLLPARAFRSEHYTARFQREVRASGGLEHPAIVNATDAGQHEGTHYLVMEYIDGLDLSRIARVAGKFSIADACSILRTAALGLSHAHAAGIVHRDIKPSNLMLSTQGQTKILDFGLARHDLWDEASAELTTVGQLMGTLDYMAPEQAERADAVDYRADLYSLGATLFRLLCGHAPLAAAPNLSPLAKLRLLATHESPSLASFRPDAPPELVSLVKSLLARDPAERPASAAHVAESLQPFATGADLTTLVATAQAQVALQPLEEAARTVASAAIPLSRDTNASQVSSSWLRNWLTAAALLPLFALAAVLITLELQKGQLVIESDTAHVSVSLLKDGEFYQQLKIEPGVNTTRLYAGSYRVDIDAGSDSLRVDGAEVTIQKGETSIARVRTIPSKLQTEPKLETFPPSPTPPDAAIVLDPLSPVSRAREIIEELSLREQELLATVGSGHPSLQAIQRQLKFRRDAVEAQREPLYDGKPLSEWLDLLTREKSPEKLKVAFDAIAAMSNETTGAIITPILIRYLRETPKLSSARGFSANDIQGFSILSKANPGDNYPKLLVQELNRGDLGWSFRILNSSSAGLSADQLPELVAWIDEHLLQAAQPSELLTLASKLLIDWIQRGVPSEAQADAYLELLLKCPQLGVSTWLSHLPSADGSTLNPKYLAVVVQRAQAAIIDTGTPPQYVAQAAMILTTPNQKNASSLVGDTSSKQFEEALRRRLAESTLSSQSLDLTHVDSDFTLATMPKNPSLTAAGIRITGDSRNGSQASVKLELLKLVSPLNSKTFEPELKAVHQATQLGFEIVSFFMKKNRDRVVYLMWPQLRAELASQLQASGPTPSPADWLSYFSHLRVLELLPELAPRAEAAPPQLQNVKPSPTELIYEGKTLVEWLKLLAQERSPTALGEAFAAVKSLMTPETSGLVTQSLLRLAPKLDGAVRLPSTSSRTYTIDARVFPLLKTANPGSAYYDLMIQQIDSSQDVAWLARCLSAEATLEANPPADMQSLLRLLETRVLVDEPYRALRPAMANFMRNVVNKSMLSADEDRRLIECLLKCEALGNDFWLSRMETESTSSVFNTSVETSAWNPVYSDAVSRQAVAALAAPDTPPQFVAQAAMILARTSRSDRPVWIDALRDALRDRLRQFAADPEQRYAAARIDSAFSRQVAFRGDWIGMVASVSMQSTSQDKCWLALKLLDLVVEQQLSRELEPELVELFQAAKPLALDVELKLLNIKQQRWLISRNFGLSRSGFDIQWPNMHVDSRANIVIDSAIASQHWQACILMAQTVLALPASTRDSLMADWRQESEMNLLTALVNQHDADRDGSLNALELESLSSDASRKLELSMADKNADRLVSVEELRDYVQAGLPNPASQREIDAHIGSAKRQISKYDLNSDGQLTANEWEKMIIKPIGADTNGDGIITAEEYAAFRTNK